ncbi:MAG: GH25 family lysozyme [Candidatus Melainabacteria bacterium]|nr:GH25 family lysozyme [Candidatus Melainabacteria bacterium]
MSKRKKVADTRLFGIDVAHHEGVIDWKKVSAAGVKYAFLKASEASTFKDKRFKFNRAECAKNGIPSGGYHFFRPHSQPISKQVNNFVSMIGAMKEGELPPVLDLEVPESWKSLSLKQRLNIVRSWLDGVENALNVKPIIYLSSSFAGDILGSDKFLANYILWVANYGRSSPRVPEPWKSGPGWTFWQFSETGRIDGISDDLVDLNWFNGDAVALKKLLWKSE